MKSSNAGGGAGNEPAYAGNAEDGRNILLAYQVLRSIAGSLPLEVIGVKREHYKVLREVRVPAILVEGGFMTDEEDARRIYDADFRQRMARAIVNGIVAYKKAVEDTAPPGTPARLPAQRRPPGLKPQSLAISRGSRPSRSPPSASRRRNAAWPTSSSVGWQFVCFANARRIRRISPAIGLDRPPEDRFNAPGTALFDRRSQIQPRLAPRPAFIECCKSHELIGRMSSISAAVEIRSRL
jgi:hypothetical protein